MKESGDAFFFGLAVAFVAAVPFWVVVWRLLFRFLT